MWVKLLQVSPLSISQVLTFNLQKRHHVMHTLCCNFTRIYTSFLFCRVGEAAPLISSGRAEAQLTHGVRGAQPNARHTASLGKYRLRSPVLLSFSFGFCYLLWYLLRILAFLSGSKRQRNPPECLAIQESSQKPSGGWAPPAPWFLPAGRPPTRGVSAYLTRVATQSMSAASQSSRSLCRRFKLIPA